MRLEHLLSGEDDCPRGLGLSQGFFTTDVYLDIEKDEAEFGAVSRQLEASPIAQLVRAPH